MTAITPISAKRMTAVLRRLGFELLRQRGSHAYYKHPDGRSAVVPMHAGEDLGKGIVREILRSIGISSEEFARLRKRL
ncbi:MAG: type II toxin-antitoxin system HicA family toxin [Armatimonadetes bacterium]|nr:type II toxin-antitoxin system HicA family toxin [Armatimonadota bacterium]